MPRPYHILRPGQFLVGLTTSFVLLAAMATSTDAANLRRTAIVRAVEGAQPSVVNIHGRKTVRADQSDLSAQSDGFKQVNGMGTGIVIDNRGYIVTNYHVIEGVNRILVTTAAERDADGNRREGETVIARLVAHDPNTDLAIIKIDVDRPLAVIRIGTSSDLMAGEPVIAIGNAYGYEHTVTRGIISALHRPVQVSEKQKYLDLIQTDASINPGNSGGPLLNIEGDMIGINVAIRVGAQGIGFAVPIDQAIDVAAQLLGNEVARTIEHGVSGQTIVTPQSSKFVLTSVTNGSSADRSGLRSGDEVTAIDGSTIKRTLDFERAILGRRAGDRLAVIVNRGGTRRNVSLVLSDSQNTAGSLADRSWSVFGLKLEPISQRSFRQLNSRYNGGLKVVAVRGDGPAAKQGIRYGDVLVGLHKWETVSLDNIAYILDSDEFRRVQPMKFYILRDAETLYGHMRASLNGG
jgi:serine protease Do